MCFKTWRQIRHTCTLYIKLNESLDLVHVLSLISSQVIERLLLIFLVLLIIYPLNRHKSTLFANNQVVVSGTASLSQWQVSFGLLFDLTLELKAHINLCYSNNEKPREVRPPMILNPSFQ